MHRFPNAVLYGGQYLRCGLTKVTTDTADDGSGYQLVASTSSPTVTSPAGATFKPPVNNTTGIASYTDRNGNKITTDGSGNFYDATSATVPVLVVTGSGTPASPMRFTYKTAAGSSVWYQINYSNYTIATNFGISGIGEYKSAAAVALPSSIALPDGSQYSFTYEGTPNAPSSGACTPYSGTSCVTARIKSVTVSTGGTISYAYYNLNGNFPTCTSGNNGIFSGGSASCLQRTMPNGNVWTYTRALGTNAASTTTVTDPQSNVTTIQFQGIYETERVVKNSSGTTLLTTDTCYNGAASPCTGTSVSASITQRSVVSTIPTTGAGTLQTKRVAMYSGYGAPTEFDDYAFGSNTVGAPLRKTLITYASLGSITAFRQQVTVQDGSGAIVSQTNYNYDETTPVAAPTGTPQLTSVTGSRGNLTSIQRCTNTASCSSSYIKTATMTYDTAGQVQTIKDGNANTTSLSYADNFYDDNGSTPPGSHSALGYPTDAFVTSVTLPVSGNLSYGYYFYTGQLAASADRNGNITGGVASYNHFQDSLWRLTSAVGPSAGSGRPWILNVYASSETQVDSYTGITDTSVSSTCSSCRHDETLLDSLGRNIHGYLVSDPEGQTKVDTVYDNDGRVQTMSHPYRNVSDSTYGLETPTYDALGRTTKVTHPDGTYSQTLYGPAIGSSGLASQNCSSSTYGLGYPVLSIDESGRKRQTWADALGKTIEGDEPDSSGNLTSYTCYSYNVLGNPLQIVHGSQTRTFVFDPLSRLTSVTIPERSNSSGASCAVTFSYDSNSNFKTRTAPAPNQTSCSTTVTSTNSFDALNRLTKITYSDGTTPTVQYGYDGNALSGCTTTPPSLTDSNPKGRRTSMCDGSGAASWAHDAAGRVSTESRTIAGVTKTISYAYNLDSTIASVTYPSTKTITYTVSNAQRLTAAKDNASSTQFVYGASYAAPGGLSGLIAGQVSGGFSGITESHTYNNSLEYTSSQAASNTGTALNLTLNYNLSGGDNGSVTTIANNVDSGRSQTLTYDPLNRILSAASSASSGADCWGQVFGADGSVADDSVANLYKINSGTQAQPTCALGRLDITVDNNNHINTNGSSVFAYDASGNMNQDAIPGVLYSFDAENRMYKVAGVTGGPYCYLYDGNGLRVAKKSGAASDCTGGAVVKLYWRSLSGDALAESDGTGSTTNPAYNEYVFFAGRRVGSRNGAGAIFYWFADQLGTTRSITTGNGSGQTSGQLCYDADFSPYGLEMQHTEHLQTTAYQPNYRFTGYEYDSETGNYYAFARYYSPRLGRFYSTDPLGGSVGNLQSHNAYAYVTNNPLNFADPLGLCGGSGTYPDLPCPIGTSVTVTATPLPLPGTSGASGPNIHCTFGVTNGTFTACNDPNGGRIGDGQGAGGSTAGAPQQSSGNNRDPRCPGKTTSRVVTIVLGSVPGFAAAQDAAKASGHVITIGYDANATLALGTFGASVHAGDALAFDPKGGVAWISTTGGGGGFGGEVGLTGQIGYLRATSVLDLESGSTITSSVSGGYIIGGGLSGDLEGNVSLSFGADAGLSTSATWDKAQVTVIACSE